MGRAYITIEDFKAGLDSRRLEASAAPGSLQVFQNGHINRGGEIVKAKRWVPKYTLPTGTTKGLLAVDNTLMVFGSVASPGTIPVDVTYQQISNPDASAIVDVVTSENFSNKAYVVASYLDGTRHHFYDGTIVTDWYVGLVRTSLTDLAGVAEELKDDALVDPIVTPTRSGAVVTLTGKENNVAFDTTATATNITGGTDDQTITLSTTQTATASLPQITTLTLGGTFEAGDTFSFTVEDNVYGASTVTNEVATTLVAHKNKMYAAAGQNLHFSVTADPSLWRNNTENSTVNAGAGVIDMSAQSNLVGSITGLGIYQNLVAIFSRNTIQIWSVDADPAISAQLQVLQNTGTRSPKAIKSFGDLDLFYIHDSGIRSLRARDSSNSASVTDVGTPIDDIVLATMENMTNAQITAIAAEIEPRDGRYIADFNGTQYVFSFFSSSKISAWSSYVPGFTITDFAVLDGKLYGRSGDVIYLLGGDDNDQYTTQEVVVEMPYIDAKSIGTWKKWIGLDVVLQGTWDLFVNTNPNQPDTWIKTARLTKTSVGQMNLMMQQHSPVIKLKFVHQSDDDSVVAKLSKVVVHYATKWAG